MNPIITELSKPFAAGIMSELGKRSISAVIDSPYVRNMTSYAVEWGKNTSSYAVEWIGKKTTYDTEWGKNASSVEKIYNDYYEPYQIPYMLISGEMSEQADVGIASAIA